MTALIPRCLWLILVLVLTAVCCAGTAQAQPGDKGDKEGMMVDQAGAGGSGVT